MHSGQELNSDKKHCFAPAYEDGVTRLAATIEEAVRAQRGWPHRLSAGLMAGLEFLAEDPPLARLLFVESLTAARLEHERSLERLAEVLRPPAADRPVGGKVIPRETARILAGGLASRISGHILSGEAERLPALHDSLLQYVLAPSLAVPRTTDERRAAAL